MGQEIERKFLVKDDSYKLEAYAHSHIVQGYICSARGRTVRVLSLIHISEPTRH